MNFYLNDEDDEIEGVMSEKNIKSHNEYKETMNKFKFEINNNKPSSEGFTVGLNTDFTQSINDDTELISNNDKIINKMLDRIEKLERDNKVISSVYDFAFIVLFSLIIVLFNIK